MILVDTGPFVALCDRRDSHHRRAVRDLANLGRSTLATCEAVIAESCFHLPAAAARARLRMVLEELDVSVLGAATDPQIRTLAFHWLERYAEHEPDWADACLVALCEREESTIWTYDREFRTTWRKPNGKRIPSALDEDRR